MIFDQNDRNSTPLNGFVLFQTSELRPKRGLTPKEAVDTAKMGAQMGCEMAGEGIKTGTDQAKGKFPGGGFGSDSVDTAKNACADQAEATGNAAGEVADAMTPQT